MATAKASSPKKYVGVAPLTMVRTDPPGYVHVFAGDPVPVSIAADDLERLVEEGFLAEDTSTPEEPAADPEA